MNSKEDELSELQEQIEKYQSLLEITAAGDKKKGKPEADTANLKKLYALAFGTISIQGYSFACGVKMACSRCESLVSLDCRS